VPPDGWRQAMRPIVAAAASKLYRRRKAESHARGDGSHASASASPPPGGLDADRLFRFAMGLAMGELRGRVPALQVADAVRTEIAAR